MLAVDDRLEQAVQRVRLGGERQDLLDDGWCVLVALAVLLELLDLRRLVHAAVVRADDAQRSLDDDLGVAEVAVVENLGVVGVLGVVEREERLENPVGVDSAELDALLAEVLAQRGGPPGGIDELDLALAALLLAVG